MFIEHKNILRYDAINKSAAYTVVWFAAAFIINVVPPENIIILIGNIDVVNKWTLNIRNFRTVNVYLVTSFVHVLLA